MSDIFDKAEKENKGDIFDQAAVATQEPPVVTAHPTGGVVDPNRPAFLTPTTQRDEFDVPIETRVHPPTAPIGTVPQPEGIGLGTELTRKLGAGLTRLPGSLIQAVTGGLETLASLPTVDPRAVTFDPESPAVDPVVHEQMAQAVREKTEGLRGIAEKFNIKAEEITKGIPERTLKESPLRFILGGAAESGVPSIGLAIIATALTGSPVVGLGAMASTEFGSEFEEQRQEGATALKAGGIAGINAGIEIATESITFPGINKLIRGSKGTIGEILIEVAKNFGEETAAGIGQTFMSEFGKQTQRGVPPKEAAVIAMEAAAATFPGEGLIGAATAGGAVGVGTVVGAATAQPETAIDTEKQEVLPEGATVAQQLTPEERTFIKDFNPDITEEQLDTIDVEAARARIAEIKDLRAKSEPALAELEQEAAKTPETEAVPVTEPVTEAGPTTTSPVKVKPLESKQEPVVVELQDYSNLDPTQKITIITAEDKETMTVEEAVYRLDEISGEENAELNSSESALLNEEAALIQEELNKLGPQEPSTLGVQKTEIAEAEPEKIEEKPITEPKKAVVPRETPQQKAAKTRKERDLQAEKETGLKTSDRNKLVQKFKKRITESESFKTFEDVRATDITNERLAQAPKLDFGANRPDVAEYIDRVSGKGHLWQYVARKGETGIPWDSFAEELSLTTTGEPITDPRTLIEAIDRANELQRKESGVFEQAIRDSIEAGDVGVELDHTIFTMLRERHDPSQIDEVIRIEVDSYNKQGFNLDINEFLIGAKRGEAEKRDVKVSREAEKAKEVEAPKVKKEKDLIGRPVLKGGATGKQQEFLDKEDFKTLQERERIVKKKDIEGQEKLFEPKGKRGFPGSRRTGELSLRPEVKARKTVSARKIIKGLSKAFNVPFRTMATNKPRNALGWYEVIPKGIRQINPRNLGTAFHEIGHHIDHEFKVLGKRKKAPAGASAELVKLGKALYGNKKPKGGYKGEGVAEYVRGYITEGIDVAKEAPNFHKWVQETFKKNNPEVWETVEKAKQLYTIFRTQGSRARIRSQRVKGDLTNTMTEGLGKLLLKLDTDWRDEFAPLRKGMKDAGIKRETLKPSDDPYMQSIVFADKAGSKLQYWLFEGMTNTAGEVTGPSLQEVLGPVTGDIERFLDWAHAAIAIQEAKRGINTGLEVTDAQFIYDKDKNDVYEKALKGWSDWSRGGLDYMVEAGALPAEVRNNIVKRRPLYIPLQRAFEKGEIARRGGTGKGLTAGKPIKKLKGSGREIVDPIMSSLQNMEKMISVSQKVMITRSLAKLSKREGVAGLIWKVPPPKQATRFTAEQIKKDIVRLAVEKLGLDLSEGIPGSVLEQWDDLLTVFTNAGQYRGKDNIVMIEFDGEKNFYEVNPDLYSVLEGLDQYTMPWFMDLVLGKPARMLRLGATGINPSFGLLRNPARDIGGFTVLAKHAKTPAAATIGIAKDIAADVSDIAEKFGINIPKSRDVMKFKAMGGEMSVQVLHDRRGQKHLRSKVLASSGKKWTIHTFLHPVDAMREITGITETGVRIGEFGPALKYAEKKFGKGSLDAAIYATYHAQDVTTNFTRHGRVAKKLNQAIAFFNAAIQGPDKILRTFKERPLRTTLYGIAALTLPAIWLWWKNKDEKWYKALPEHEKYGYMHYQVDDDTIIRWPVPFELGHIFQTLPVAAMDAMYNEDPQQVKDAFAYSLKQANPVDWPAAINPIMDIKANEDFAGRSIIPRSVEGKLPEDQFGPYTTTLMKKIGKTVGASPAQIEHLVNSYSGGVYKRVARTVDNFTNEKELTPSDYPVIGTLFMRDPKRPASLTDDYYTRRNELEQKFRSKQITRAEIAERKAFNSVVKLMKKYRDELYNTKTQRERDEVYSKIDRLLRTPKLKLVKKK